MRSSIWRSPQAADPLQIPGTDIPVGSVCERRLEIAATEADPQALSRARRTEEGCDVRRNADWDSGGCGSDTRSASLESFMPPGSSPQALRRRSWGTGSCPCARRKDHQSHGMRVS